MHMDIKTKLDESLQRHANIKPLHNIQMTHMFDPVSAEQEKLKKKKKKKIRGFVKRLSHCWL
jgi:hypothetical protein